MSAITHTLAGHVLLLGLVFTGLTVILIDRFVLRPLAQLEASVRHITRSSDREGRVPIANGTVVSSLAHSINDMLTAVEQAQFENTLRIQETRRQLEELRAANERLTELDRLKSQFVANVSHELRTPLNAILGFGELLLDDVPGPLNAEQRDYVQRIEASGQYLLELTDDILDLSTLQAGHMALNRRTAYFADLVMTARTFLWPGIQRKRQALIVEVPPDLPGLFVDPLRVKQILINLLSNASKFTPPAGRLVIHAEVWQTSWLRASVSDTGPGIPPEKHADVFEEFAQLHREQPVVERGTGLGLAITRRLIELHGGQIWIDSAGLPGAGTTFYFTLPLADAAAMQRQTSA